MDNMKNSDTGNLLQTFKIDMAEAAACKPGRPPLVASVRLDQDIGNVFPYLNAKLKAVGYNRQQPAMIIRQNGRQIALEPNLITISDLASQAEAETIMKWLKDIINTTWQNRVDITPVEKVFSPPGVINILALLPKTNCLKCGMESCMAFAASLSQGKTDIPSCLELSEEQRKKLEEYLQAHTLE